jgi:hypothetical protein
MSWVIVVGRACAATVNERVAVVELPALSVAFARKVYAPSLRPVAGRWLFPGPEHDPKAAVPVSIEQVNVAF